MIEMSAKAMTLTNLGVFTASNPTSESFIVTVTKAEHFGDGSSRKKKNRVFNGVNDGDGGETEE